MRPNYAQDAPPTSIEVGGNAYKCNVDYRVWIEIHRKLRDLILEPSTPEHDRHNAELCDEIQVLAFGGILADEHPADVMHGIFEFAAGYPSAPTQSPPGDEAPTFSFEYDLNEIIIAIRNQSGIDLSYRRTEPFHWWEFLLEFRTLCGEHYILNLIEIRGYKGKDKEMLARKRRCALPVEHTAEEQALLDAIDAEFDGQK